MSTTIIQGSPVPSEEQAVEKLRGQGPFESRGKRTLSYIIQKNSDMENVTETTSLTSKPEDLKPNFSLRKELCCQSGDVLESSTRSMKSGPSELSQMSLAVPGGSDHSHPAVSMPPLHPVVPPATVNHGDRVTSGDALKAHCRWSGQVPPEPASRAPHSTDPSTEPHGPAAPAFSTLHAFPTVPFTQQNSEAPPSARDMALPHAGSTPACGLLGSCPYPAVPVAGEHMGICLGQNNRSGLMGSSLCNLYSNTLNQNFLSTAKLFPGQPIGTNCGIELWDSGMMSGSGKMPFLCYCLLLLTIKN